ncbi:tankyrase-2-like [Stylophora pistillata]|uniref:Ankyrin-3 n=1 Tax=Stylophora pistillata TaxID=50429 RepID=A0A2B4RPJ3_STYPI|nr:tankyrase-2-like [Stylophora pistillata]PFX18450.1 Ankyrin-3 [Stylophora pistillata]
MAERMGGKESDDIVCQGKKLWTALRKNPTDKERVLELLRNRAPPNFRDPCNPKFNWTPLHFVVNDRLGDLELINMLLEHGAETNLGDSYDFTPLHLAAEKGYLKTVERLLTNQRSPADRTKQNFGKETALDIVERKLKEPRPEVADKTLLESEKAKRKDLHSVASYLRNDQIADFHIDGPANVTILVQPDSNVNVDIDKADTVVMGDKNTITKH